MAKHLENELNNIKNKLLLLSHKVEKSLEQAVLSIKNLDPKLAEQVIKSDIEIDLKEVELEEDVLKCLALYQPVAVDLRFLVVTLKINNDLERIADLACNIASRAMYLSKLAKIQAPFDFDLMSAKTLKMVHESIKSLIDLDLDLAKQVCKDDDEVDAINKATYPVVFDRIKENSNNVEQLIHYLSISRFLERSSDLATNIAEDIIYMVEGVIVRHYPDGTSSEISSKESN